ncbi:MAG: YfiT family bacillithiol transferase [Bacteroidota bacterium]
MEEIALEKLKYPIGKYEVPNPITEEQLSEWISILEHLPAQYEGMVTTLTEAQLETPYRPGGWTVRQVVHHVSDSHHNSYIRFKWALTEDNPVIKPYFEKEWANLFDTRTAPIQMSLDHLKAVHFKLVYLLKGLSKEQLLRTFTHPEGNSVSTLEENIGRYAWHGSHHFAHIKNLIDREGW